MNEGVSAAANGGKVFCNGGGHLQDPGTGMPHESAWNLKQSPARGGDTMTLPAFPQSGMLEQDKQVMGDNPDPEERGIGTFLTTRHSLHAKADFEFFDAIFGMLTPLAIPDQHVGSTTAAVAGDDVVTGPVFFQQLRLMVIAHDNEPEGFVGMLHALHGLGHGAVSIVGPGRFGNRGNGRQGRGIQLAADGEGFSRLFAIVKKIRLMTGGVRTDGGQGVTFGQACFAGFE